MTKYKLQGWLVLVVWKDVVDSSIHKTFYWEFDYTHLLQRTQKLEVGDVWVYPNEEQHGRWDGWSAMKMDVLVYNVERIEI